MSEDVAGSDVTRPLTAGDAPVTRVNAGRASLLALPSGHRLQEFVIESTIGEGGFGVVYLARDTELNRVVAIKEFLPSAFASRTQDLGVSVRSDQDRDSFEIGRRSFINEARLLAQFEHPSLVKVYRYWEENGTAYIAMPYYAGLTLKDWLHARQGKVSEERLLRFVDALCAPLEMLHSKGVFHRDIAPDNIRILENGQPVLLDLGAARKILADMTQTVTAFIKSGYAPIEQYADAATLRQGPWSDIYALSATLYYCVAGRAPPASVARMVQDDCVAATVLGAGRFSPRFLAAIDRGLAVRPEERIRTIADLRASLGIRRARPRPIAAAAGLARRAARPRTGVIVIGIGTLLLVALTATRFLYEDPKHRRAAAAAAAAAPPSAEVLQAQQAIAEAQARIAAVKEVLSGQRDVPVALFETADAALDDARVKLTSGQTGPAAEIARAAADDAARSARGFLQERQLAYRQAADRKLRSGDIAGAESALNDAKAVRALARRI